VLVALFDEDDDVHVVLTRRAAGLRSHTGEVSFPGGRLEPGETAMAAALRESREEVDLDAVDVVAQLSPLSTWSSDSTIIPFVGLLAQRPVLHPNPFEVERAFTVSLSELASPACYHEELWPSADGTLRSMAFFDVVGDTVWGATGRILDDLLSRLAGTTPGDPDSLGIS
jgi:8-oxo-dGTP pyrophosphatase MutT (NUDIX family)